IETLLEFRRVLFRSILSAPGRTVTCRPIGARYTTSTPIKMADTRHRRILRCFAVITTASTMMIPRNEDAVDERAIEGVFITPHRAGSDAAITTNFHPSVRGTVS